MQETGKKGKHAAKHAAPMPEPVETEKEIPADAPELDQDEAYADDYDLYGDEAEIPFR